MLVFGSDYVEDLPTIDLFWTGSGEVVPCVDDSGDLPVLELASGEVSGVSPIVNKWPAVGGCDRSMRLPAVAACVAESDGLPDYVTPDVGRPSRNKRKREPKDVGPARLASANTPWRELPYLRTDALRDIPTVAGLYGVDLLNELPEADWLNVEKVMCVCGPVSPAVSVTLARMVLSRILILTEVSAFWRYSQVVEICRSQLLRWA